MTAVPRSSATPSRARYVRAQGLLDQQLRLSAYDVAGGDLAGGWQLRTGSWSGLAEYGNGLAWLESDGEGSTDIWCYDLDAKTRTKVCKTPYPAYVIANTNAYQ